MKSLKILRCKKNYTQKDVSEVLQIAQQQYNRYETGKREMPLRYLIKLADFYEISLDELVGRERV